MSTKHVLTSSAEKSVDPRILPIYKQCWEEFYEDEQAYCLQTLCDLAKGVELDDEDDILDRPMDAVADDRMSVDGASHLNDFSVVEAADGEPSLHLETEVVEIRGVEPWPVYYSCAPANTYFRWNEERTNAVLQSIRYGGVEDTSLFDERLYMSRFHEISWQAPYRDPDCEYDTKFRRSD